MKEMEEEKKRLQAALTAAREGNSKNIKIEPPEKFDGKRSQLRSFLTHAKLYLTFKEDQFPSEAKKVLAIAAFLKGQAFEWFEPRMRDYLENDHEDRDAATDELFTSYDNFAKELKSVFGEVDEKRSAERELRMLKQTGSAKQYATEFRRITAKLNKDEESLQSDFYTGLKPFLKTEFALHEPGDLQDMISMAVKLDGRMYEAQLENRGNWKSTGYSGGYNNLNAGRKEQKHHSTWYRKDNRGKDPDAIEIDMVHKGPQRQLNKQQQE
jgi:Ty3 transposon capsid-like protein